LIEALIKTELVPSKSQGRTLLAQQAVRVNDHIVTDENQPLTEASALQGRYHILRKGKKEYALIELS
jgi:tyrosyl-tRNA synthetase